MAEDPHTRLRELRIANSLTQEKAAERFGCAASYISKIENRERVPGRRIAKRIEVVTTKLGDPILVGDWDDEDFED
jgi:transcriptional regulator with XRE-family HTH domain